MSHEDPELRSYRRIVVGIVLTAGAIAAGVGVWLLWQGKFYPAFLALLLVGFVALLAHGYRQDQEERR